MDSLGIEGGCLCRAVRYRATGEPTVLTLCHCRSCRHAAGAPSVGWVVFNARDFAFVSGEPTRFESSPGVTRTFCGRCGTPLTYQRDSRPDSIDATTATLDHPDDFAPTKEIWLSHKLRWEAPNPAMQQFPESSVQRPLRNVPPTDTEPPDRHEV
jgi:hypothetical protein